MKNLTQEQKDKAMENKERFKGIVKKIAQLSQEQRNELALKMPLINPEGHHLSIFNTCLIYHQSNGYVPTVVGGFKQWLKQGRAVKRGEHSFMIWFPRFQDHKEEPTEEEIKEEKVTFLIGHVFDISQTIEIQTS